MTEQIIDPIGSLTKRDFIIRRTNSGDRYIALRDAFDEGLINEMEAIGVREYVKHEVDEEEDN